MTQEEEEEGKKKENSIEISDRNEYKKVYTIPERSWKLRPDPTRKQGWLN